MHQTIFQDANKAREFLENARWPNGPICPHCGAFENIHRLAGKAHRPGLFQCNACLGQFSVTVGTVFERSKIPLNQWLFATNLLSSSKKGISSHQLHRTLGVTYKTAWFMSHRTVSPASVLHTDESRLYPTVGAEMAGHETVHHSSGEYVRGDVHTNTVEGFFSIFKRGMDGVYQHCSEKHLSRYLDEFSFRYSNRIAHGVDDADRTLAAFKGIEGKRLTYRRIGDGAN